MHNYADVCQHMANNNIIYPLHFEASSDNKNITIAASKGHEKQRELEKLNILIIDDDEMCRDSVEYHLFGSNFNLIKIDGGEAGLNYLASTKKKIDLILLDLMMPDIDGISVLRKLKADSRLKDIPVIIQTATSDVSELTETINCGAEKWIRKPYTKELLLSSINKIINKNKNI